MSNSLAVGGGTVYFGGTEKRPGCQSRAPISSLVRPAGASLPHSLPSALRAVTRVGQQSKGDGGVRPGRAGKAAGARQHDGALVEGVALTLRTMRG